MVDRIKKSQTTIIIGACLILYLISSAAKSQNIKPNTLVVGIAEWRHAGGSWMNIQQNTYDLLIEKLKPHGFDDVQVVKVPAVLENARWVDQIASKFGIDVLIWGWYDEVAVRGYVDLANAIEDNGMTNSLPAFLNRDGNPTVIQVLKILSEFDYYQEGVSFCVPRWNP